MPFVWSRRLSSVCVFIYICNLCAVRWDSVLIWSRLFCFIHVFIIICRPCGANLRRRHASAALATGHLRQPRTGPNTARSHRCAMVLLAELCALRWSALLFVLVLGHSVQGYVRVGHRLVQAHVLQCHAEYAENLDAGGGGHYIDVRMLQVAGVADNDEQSALFDDCAVCDVDILALLRLVGVHQLLQRRILQPMESSVIFHGKSVVHSGVHENNIWTNLFICWTDNRISFHGRCPSSGQYR